MKRRTNHLCAKVAFILFITLFVYGCGGKKTVKIKDYSESILYNKADMEFKKKDFKNSIKSFKQVNELYPFSYLGKRAQMMAALASYSKKDYAETVLLADSYIKLYSDGEDIEYMYYLAGIASLDKLKKIENDIEPGLQAKKYFTALLEKFPNSEYKKSANEKLLLTKEIIASKELSIAIFYLNHVQYQAAIHRLNDIIGNYSDTKFYSETLFRLVEGYEALALHNEAIKNYDILKKKFPQSKWTLYADRLMK